MPTADYADPPWLFSTVPVSRSRGVVGEGGATDTARLFFPSNADEKGMQPRRLGRVKHRHGTAAGRDHLAIGKADPLVPVLTEELVADSPVALLVLTPVGMDLPGDLWW